MKKVLLTGGTGFLGSHILEELVKNHFNVMVIKRKSSNTWRCDMLNGTYINWINIDENGWESKVLDFNPQIFIHGAWSGVASFERIDLLKQFANVNFFAELLNILKNTNLEKIICLGSQAEYGFFENSISESSSINPNSAYGLSKNIARELLEYFINNGMNKVKWYWLRLFSVFGEKESDNWLIPSTIKCIHEGSIMNFSAGLQRYAYLYVKDFTKMIIMIVESTAESGIYNISSQKVLTLKDLIIKIETILQKDSNITFGVLPYRDNQIMHLQGSMDKFISNIGFFREGDLDVNLKSTVLSYITK